MSIIVDLLFISGMSLSLTALVILLVTLVMER